MTIRIGTAPVSYGVFGTSGDRDAGETLLDSAAAAGFSGLELGPPALFGTPRETVEHFQRRRLEIVGAYIPIHFAADDQTVAADLANMRRTLEELTAGGASRALAILADEGSPILRINPARSWSDRSLALDDEGWRLLGRRLGQAVSMAAGFSVPVSFHPHIGTYVESPWEVERLLELSDIPLTLDTGHFALAGADPAGALDRFGDRVNHIHAKDVRLEVLQRAKAERRTDFETWWADVSCPLGHGDVDLEAFLDLLVARGYDGWIVIEQDRAPIAAAAFADVAGEQAVNRRWIEAALVRRGVGFGGRPGT
jgi:inosose dehydratase